MSLNFSPPWYSDVIKCGRAKIKDPTPSKTKPPPITCGMFLSAFRWNHFNLIGRSHLNIGEMIGGFKLEVHTDTQPFLILSRVVPISQSDWSLRWPFRDRVERYRSDFVPRENVTYNDTRIKPISYETAIRPVIHDSNPNLVSNVVIEILTKPLTVAPFQIFRLGFFK